MTSVSHHHQRVAPISWRFLPAGLAAYEFDYTGTRASLTPKLKREHYGPFITELARELTERTLLDVFGICCVDDPDINVPTSVEVTSGRANIVLDIDIDMSEETDDNSLIETVCNLVN